MKVAMLMTPEPFWVRSQDPLDRALALMDERGVRHLPVLDGGRLVGIVSDRDLLAATGWLPASVHACRGPAADRRLVVEDVMQSDVVTTGPQADVVGASMELVHRAIGCLPVLERGELVGILTETDVLRSYASDARGAGWRPLREDPPIDSVMTRDPTTVSWFTTLHDATELCRRNGLRHLPVVEAGAVVGILSDRDLRRAAGAGRNPETQVDELMTRSPETGAPEWPLSRAAGVLARRKIGALPILDGDDLVGILTTTDVLAHCLDAYREDRPA